MPFEKYPKSKCCNAKTYKINIKRRQCSVCKKTWTLKKYKSKRGRKKKKISNKKLLKMLFEYNFNVKQTALMYKTHHVQMCKLIKRSLNKLTKQKRVYNFHPNANYIVIIDAQTRFFKDKHGNKQNWGMYNIAYIEHGKAEAIFLDPIMLKGKETFAKWEYICKQKCQKSLKNKHFSLSLIL